MKPSLVSALLLFDGLKRAYAEEDSEEITLEAYSTPLDDEDCPIDEYNVFKEVLGAIQSTNPGWYSQLTSHLSENQGKALTEVITLANQRVAAKESKVIEQQGGKERVTPGP